MWIWWIISLVVLIACFIFAYKMIMSSFDFLPADKKSDFLRFRNRYDAKADAEKNELVWDLRNKLQKMEENATFYEMQFSKLQQRLKTLEENTRPAAEEVELEEEEDDWKEMYYQENEEKQKIENALDEANQKLENTETELKELAAERQQWAVARSEYDARLRDIQSMQNELGLLQRQLEASEARAKELEQFLARETAQKEQLTHWQNEFVKIRDENEELKSHLLEMSRKQGELETAAARASELESKMHLYEEEKAKMLADLERMFSGHRFFSGIKNSQGE